MSISLIISHVESSETHGLPVLFLPSLRGTNNGLCIPGMLCRAHAEVWYPTPCSACGTASKASKTLGHPSWMLYSLLSWGLAYTPFTSTTFYFVHRSNWSDLICARTHTHTHTHTNKPTISYFLKNTYFSLCQEQNLIKTLFHPINLALYSVLISRASLVFNFLNDFKFR